MKTHTLIAALLTASIAVIQAAPFGWGDNRGGMLGDGTTTDRTSPVAANVTGVLATKTITAITGGDDFTAVLTSDGKVFTWGYNNWGQLGDGTTTTSSAPVAVDMSGALSGKTVTAIAAGDGHCLALTSDGKVYGWGFGDYGCLGNGVSASSSVPVEVDMTGAMSGKTVTAISARYLQSMALTSDGKVYTWGANTLGVLGDGTTTFRYSPVAVDTSGLLSGKTIVAIAMGNYHGVAVSSAGRVYAWGGYGSSGTLGDGLATDSLAPVAVDTSGALSGKRIVSVAAGQYHTLALSSDGLVYAWGFSLYGELGDGAVLQRNSPVAVDTSGLLASRTVTAIDAGSRHSLALTSDGLVCGWGGNLMGQLGDGTGSNSSVPVAVDVSGVMAGMAATAIGTGNYSGFALAAPVTTTILPAGRFTYAANFSWLNWRWSATSADAPVIESNILRGRVYASDVGWIYLGDGTPTDGVSYSQVGPDFGVNNDGAGGLTGYAYGANIGWIKFSQTWNSPSRVDLATGALSGYAYSANCGWINLSSLKSRMLPGTDFNGPGGAGNGIADAWERQQAITAGLGSNANLLALAPNADYDRDGVSDYAEYLADTNPFSADDHFKVTTFNYNNASGDVDIDWTGSDRRQYKVYCSPDLINWTLVGTPQVGSGAALTLGGQPARHLFFKVEALLPLAGP